MTEYKIGADKARAILNHLQTTDPRMTGREPGNDAATAVPIRADDPAARFRRSEKVGAGTAPQAPADSTPDTESAAVTAGTALPTPAQVTPQVTDVVDPGTTATVTAAPTVGRRVRSWPVLLLAAPAFVAVWSGWVGLGELTGFGVVHPLPGIADEFAINSAITLPIGVETYAAFALRVWLSGQVPANARQFAKWSAIGSLILGALGQVAYHLLSASGVTSAPPWITTVVACLPVAVLGMGAALAHLLHQPGPRHD